jgi:hypothetical protein
VVEGDEDAGVEEDAGPPIPTCPSPAEACGVSDYCVAMQVLDFVTGMPVSPADNLLAVISDPLAGTDIGFALVDGENGCFVAPDLGETSTPARTVVIVEADDPPPDPDRVATTLNGAGDGSSPDPCCDVPAYVVRRDEETAWNDALGLAADEGLEATGVFIGFVLNDGPVAGATVINNGAEELRVRYFNDDMSDFLDGATATGNSGAFAIVRAAPGFELANLSATDLDGTTYSTVTAGLDAGLVTVSLIFPE